MSSIAAPPATPPAPVATRPAATRHLYTRLQQDWCRLCASCRHLERARTWQLPIDPVGSLDELLGHIGYGRVGRTDEHHDEVLGALVDVAHHDELAARVVLQRILPGLWTLTRRRAAIERERGRHGRDSEFDDEVLSTAWTVIRCFRVDRRRDHIAARMIKEIEYRTFRLPHRRQAIFVPTPVMSLDRPMHDEALVDPAALLDMMLTDAARRGLGGDDVDVLRRWGAGQPAAALADVLHVTERTIRNHRAAALRRLQDLVAADSPATQHVTDRVTDRVTARRV